MIKIINRIAALILCAHVPLRMYLLAPSVGLWRFWMFYAYHIVL